MNILLLIILVVVVLQLFGRNLGRGTSDLLGLAFLVVVLYSLGHYFLGLF